MGQYEGGLGGGIVRGIETGVGIAKTQYDMERQSRLDARNEQQQAFDNDIKTRAEARLKDEDTRKTFLTALEENKGQKAAFANEMQVIRDDVEATLPPGHTPDQLEAALKASPKAAAAAENARGAVERETQIYAHLIGKDAVARLDQASKDSRDLESGKVSLENLSPKRTAAMVSTAGQVPPSDWILGANGEPSKSGAKLDEIDRLMTEGKYGEALTVGVDFLPPSAHQAEGHLTMTGAEFQGADAAHPIPHPNDPNQFSLGITGKLLHPDGEITEGATTALDGDGNVKHYSMDQLMETVARLKAMRHALESPEMQKKLADGVKDGADRDHDTFTSLFMRVGGTPTQLKRVLKHRSLDQGGYTIDITEDAEGNEIARKNEPKTPVSKDPNTAADHRSEAEKNFGLIRNVKKNWKAMGYDSLEAAEEDLKGAGVIKKSSSGLTASEEGRLEVRAEAAFRAGTGFSYDAANKQFVGPDGKVVNSFRNPALFKQLQTGLDVIKGHEPGDPEAIAKEAAAAAKIAYKSPTDTSAPSTPTASIKDQRAIDFTHKKAQGLIEKGANKDTINRNLIKNGYPPLP